MEIWWNEKDNDNDNIEDIKTKKEKDKCFNRNKVILRNNLSWKKISRNNKPKFQARFSNFLFFLR